MFAAHLPGCERCAATIAETQELMAAMAADLPQAEPSEGLLQRIRASVEEADQLPEPPVGVPVQPLRAVPGAAGRRPAAVAVAARRARRSGRGRARRHRRTRAVERRPGLRPRQAPDDRRGAERGDARSAQPGTGDDRPADVSGREARRDGRRPRRRGEPHHAGAGRERSAGRTPTCSGAWTTGTRSRSPRSTSPAHRCDENRRLRVDRLRQHDIYGISLEPGRKAPSLPTEVVATGQVNS